MDSKMTHRRIICKIRFNNSSLSEIYNLRYWDAGELMSAIVGKWRDGAGCALYGSRVRYRIGQ